MYYDEFFLLTQFMVLIVMKTKMILVGIIAIVSIFGIGAIGTHLYLENQIKTTVYQTIGQFEGSLDNVSDLHNGQYYGFILSEDLGEILVHPNKQLVGTAPSGISEADIPISEIIIKLKNNDEGVWVKYYFTNPANDQVEMKRSWLTLHEGYVFGSGYYIPFSSK